MAEIIDILIHINMLSSMETHSSDMGAGGVFFFRVAKNRTKNRKTLLDVN